MLAFVTIITALFAPLMTMGVQEMCNVRVSDLHRFMPVMGSVALCSGPIWLGLAGVFEHAELVPVLIYILSLGSAVACFVRNVLILLASDTYGDDMHYQ